MPVITIDKIVGLDKTRIDDVNLTPLISKTAIKIIDRNISEAKAITAEIINDFKILCSFCLYPIIIPKKIIDKNIKNSTITRIMNSVRRSPSEKFPVTTDDRNNFNVSKNVGEIYIIIIETSKHANPEDTSIIAVKYFELISSFFVTGSVWVRYASSL